MPRFDWNDTATLAAARHGFRAHDGAHLRRVTFTLDDDHTWTGFTDDTLWNGWLNVRVTPDVRAGMVATYGVQEPAFDDECDLSTLPQDPDGLIDLNGYIAMEVDSE